MIDKITPCPENSTFCELKINFNDVYQTFVSSLPHFRALFANGGYIAGGAARSLLSKLLELNKLYHFVNDIDFFFSDAEHLQQGYKEFSAIPTARNSPIDVETDYTITIRKTPETFQLIKSNYGSVFDVLSKFDFENSMVAYDGNRFIFSENFISLERNNILHARKDTCIERIVKYVTQKQLVPDEQLYEQIQKKIGEKLQNICDSGKMSKEEEKFLLTVLQHAMMKHVNNEDLIMLASIIPSRRGYEIFKEDVHKYILNGKVDQVAPF
jgi:hypothetical protein